MWQVVSDDKASFIAVDGMKFMTRCFLLERQTPKQTEQVYNSKCSVNQGEGVLSNTMKADIFTWKHISERF